jgi:hypothetical protein
VAGQVVEDLNQQAQGLEPTLELGGIVRVGLDLLVGDLGGLSVHGFNLCVNCALTAKSRTKASPKCSTTWLTSS